MTSRGELIQVLIIGLGRISLGYDLTLNSLTSIQTHARAFSLHNAFKLVGGVDPDPEKRKLFEKNYSCTAFHSLEDSLKQTNPSLVVIAVPTTSHYKTILDLLRQYTPQAILCEKPFTNSYNHAKHIASICESRNVEIYVNYIRRSDPAVLEIKKRIQTGYINKPIKTFVWYSKGLFNNGSHFINLMQFWLGDFIFSQPLSSTREYPEGDIELDVKLSFKYGDVIMLSAWEEAYTHYSIELLCRNGRLRYERGGDKVYWNKLELDPTLEGYRFLATSHETISSDMQRYQYNVADQISKSISGKDSFICNANQALTTHLIIQDILSKQ